MFAQLDIFRTAGGLARHAAIRQNVIAENIANADTPGYKARDIAPFAETWRAAGDAASGLRRTRPGHISLSAEAEARLVPAGSAPSTNGNAVSVEAEMLNAVDVRRQHDRALAIYRSGLSLLRASLGRR